MTKMALIGNPNSGKTSLFNLLTGTNQRVGNWPGVTVDRKSGLLKSDKTIEIQDLPGVYSMSPYSPEEQVARDYLLSQDAQVIINVVDGTHLERNLYLTTQLMEMGMPLVMALNMSDVLEASQKQINLDKLSYQLGFPIVATSALKNTGLNQLISSCQKEIAYPKETPYFPIYDNRLEAALAQIMEVLQGVDLGMACRYYSLKLFERDPLVQQALVLEDALAKEIEMIIKITEDVFGEDAESIVINERYAYIEQVCHMAQIETNDLEWRRSDQIDRIVTNRFLALPIFALAMFLVYFLAIQTVGTMGTDWVNDVLFGDYVPNAASTALDYLKVEAWLQSLIIDGILAGIGAVIGFVPQIFVLFICLGILEDIGYMSRIAFVMDRIFRRFGLSGKSFIPMLIATGCGVPAIMASRTIENERDRKITIMTATFMPCSAKLAIIALISGAFFPNNPFIASSAYFVGIASIILSGIALKKTKLLGGQASPFIMELPAYHLPNMLTVTHYAFGKAWSFVKRAGTIIFALTILIWFLSTYNGHLQVVKTDHSLLADFGRLFAWLFKPLGFGNWKATVAALTGLLAKETVVATFGILYHQADATETSRVLWTSLQMDYTALAAYSFLLFNLLCAPCFAAIGAIKREMNSVRWSLFAIGFQTGLAYLLSFILYQVGLVFMGQEVTFWTILAGIGIVALLYAILRKPAFVSDQVITMSNLERISQEEKN